MKLSEEEKSQLGQLLTMLLGLIVPVLLAYLSEYIYSPKPFIRAKVENYKYYSVSSPCVAAYTRSFEVWKNVSLSYHQIFFEKSGKQLLSNMRCTSPGKKHLLERITS